SAAVWAGTVAVLERGDHKVAYGDARHIRADLLHHAYELVPDRALGMGRLSAVVPEVRPADATQHDSDNGVCRCRNGGIGPPTDLDGVRSLKDGGAHGYAPSVDGAAAYSAALPWSPHGPLFPLSSASGLP